MDFSLNNLDNRDCMISIKNEHRPIFVYGMGNGALKIMHFFEEYSIKIAGFFASDEFARGHSFCGFDVKKLCEIESEYDDFVIVLAFAAGYDSLITKIRGLASKYTLYAPDVPLFFEGKMQLFNFEYVNENFDKLKQVYNMLADEKSRQIFTDVINFKITGNTDYLFKTECETGEEFDILSLSEDEIFVDCGAYKGDTVSEFLENTNGRYSHIYAIEPDIKNFKKLKEKFDNTDNTELFNAAVWSCDSTVCFDSKSGRQSSISESGKEISALSVDSILQGGKVTYIKYDIEGAENEGLLGSSESIKKHKPKLLVSLYHRNEDIFELPLYIRSLNADYKFYLRRKPYIPAWDTVLICINK